MALGTAVSRSFLAAPLGVDLERVDRACPAPMR